MKRIVVLALILTLTLTAAFASILQVGPAFTYKGNASNLVKEEELKKLSIDDFGVGADLRVNVFFLQLKATGTVGTNFSSTFNAATIASVNLRFAPSFFDIAIGPAVGLDIAHRDDEWTFNGVKLDDGFNILNSSKLYYHASLGFNVGLIGINVTAYLPTTGTFKESFSMKPAWQDTRVMASVLFNFF